MTPNQSKLRQHLYVNGAVLSAFIGGIVSLDTSDWRAVSVFFAGIILAANNALRAYIDTSAGDVVEPEKTIPPTP
jgi:ATP-dependent protease HslVU (ClpYQ) peptidase subunit